MKHHKSVHAIIIYKNKYFIQKKGITKKIYIFQIFGDYLEEKFLKMKINLVGSQES